MSTRRCIKNSAGLKQFYPRRKTVKCVDVSSFMLQHLPHSKGLLLCKLCLSRIFLSTRIQYIRGNLRLRQLVVEPKACFNMKRKHLHFYFTTEDALIRRQIQCFILFALMSHCMGHVLKQLLPFLQLHHTAGSY